MPATTEMLFVMGAGDRIAGVSNYDRFPPDVARLPKVGGLLDPDVERLLSLKPDLVIVYDTQTDLKRQLERARIPMFRYVHRGLPDITETMRALGERIGAKAAADAAAARIEQQLAAIRARVAGRPRPKTLLVFGREPGTLRHIDASGGYGFLHDLLELAGGADVLGDLQQAVGRHEHGDDPDARARGHPRASLRRFAEARAVRRRTARVERAAVRARPSRTTACSCSAATSSSSRDRASSSPPNGSRERCIPEAFK